MNSEQLELLKKTIQNAKSALIMLSKEAQEDEIAAGCALYLTLKKSIASVSIVSDKKMQVGMSHLFGIDKISTSINGGKKLVVSFPYNEEKINKASADVKDGRLLVVIEARGSSIDFTPEEVEYSFAEGVFDIVFVLGAKTVSDLGSIYSHNESLFKKNSVVHISKADSAEKIGTYNLLSSTAVSQSVAWLLKEFLFDVDTDSASNLYTGILSVTENMTIENADPDSLEVLAYLLRKRAQKLSFSGNEENPGEVDLLSTQKKTELVHETVKSEPPQEQKPAEKTPEDWLRPKVFTTDKTPSSV